ncbi:choice-of-anchor Q domain-containing protein [Marinicella sp. W31]|uniref:choice-of-anchor Q domain-containing protein n=1 Tax=Marinicella sp. W31 TaxID=3023713 RepID=UPI003757DE69
MKKNKLSKIIAQCLSLGIFGLPAAQSGNFITVDSISDQPEPGLTTLREAIVSGNIISGAEIVFDAELFSVPQTITLQKGEIRISENIGIFGPGKDLLTIDGNGNSRIFNINNEDESQVRAFVEGVTLTNGFASDVNGREGGCILSFEELTLRNSTVTQCESRGNGGGIKSLFATLSLESSTVSNNLSRFNGGGIYVREASTVINNTTISGNTSRGSGGGIYGFRDMDIELLNSTISGNALMFQNQEGGGVFIKERTTGLKLKNTTVFNNTGEGIYSRNSSPINFSNSVIASNSRGDCVFAQINSNSDSQNSLDTDGSCDVNASDHATVTDPMLEPLTDNGGSTQTHRPLFDSPLVDGGNDLLCLEVDQRDVLRPQDGDGDGTATCDIGAVERMLTTDIIFNNGFEPGQD